jgi:hypothetical protein
VSEGGPSKLDPVVVKWILIWAAWLFFAAGVLHWLGWE